MPTIDTRTLQIAIRAVATELRALRAEAATDDADPLIYLEIDDLERAADDLEAAYDEEAKTVLNLVPYDELVGE